MFGGDPHTMASFIEFNALKHGFRWSMNPRGDRKPLHENHGVALRFFSKKSKIYLFEINSNNLNLKQLLFDDL